MTMQDVIDGVEEWAEDNNVPANQVIYTVEADTETGTVLDYSYRRMHWWEAMETGVVEMGHIAGDGVILLGTSTGWEPGDDYLEWEDA